MLASGAWQLWLAVRSVWQLQVRIKKHRWHKKVLKNQDPLIFSIGWRRFQSIPLYCLEDRSYRKRMLKCGYPGAPRRPCARAPRLRRDSVNVAASVCAPPRAVAPSRRRVFMIIHVRVRAYTHANTRARAHTHKHTAAIVSN